MNKEMDGVTIAPPETNASPAVANKKPGGLLALARFAQNAFVSRRAPISLVHFVTERCNARCAHCFIDFDNQPRREGTLDLEEIQKLTKNLGGSVANVYLTGGEPFLRKDMAGIVEAYALNAGVKSFNITTNGFYTERTEQFVKELIERDIPAQVFIAFSIDDIEEAHDENRKLPGLFKKTIATYNMVRDAGSEKIHPNVSLTVTPANWQRIEIIYRHLRDVLAIRSVTAIAMRDEGIQKISQETRKNIWHGYEKLTALIEADRRGRSGGGYKKSLLGHLFNAKSLVWYPIQRDIFLEPHYVAPCRAGALFGTIKANGDVFPCEILEDRKLGNLRDYDYDFMGLWEDAAAAETRDFIIDSKCHCSFECAWATNIVSNPKYLPALVSGTIRSALKSDTHD
ncbi:MAG: radical SAM protein [Proteobacteria bacterium]|nr:radical SAM protein [Pseudomonadota bacterium]MDA1021720.1 radical SAM protein [Pseudomonadota bacterium]